MRNVWPLEGERERDKATTSRGPHSELRYVFVIITVQNQNMEKTELYQVRFQIWEFWGWLNFSLSLSLTMYAVQKGSRFLFKKHTTQ